MYIIILILNIRGLVVKTSMREIPGSIKTFYEFSVWDESGIPLHKFARALLAYIQ